MDNLVEILVPLGVAVALPVCIVSIIFRSAMAADRNRKEIVLAALEKNPNLNVEDLLKGMKKSEKLIKEKLLARLERGCLCCLMGVAFILLYFFCEVIRTDTYRHRLPHKLLRRPPYARQGDGGRAAEHEARVITYDERTIHSTCEE